MTQRILPTLITLALCCTGKASGEGFRQYTSTDGLSDDTVQCLYEDEDGMIWFGTRNGLNKFNGNRFIVYKYRKGDPSCLPYNNVHNIVGNGEGKLYIHSFGVSELDMESETFKTIVNQETGAICFHKKLYVGCGNQLFEYDGCDLSLVYELPSKSISINALGAEDGRILVGTDNEGVYILNEDGTVAHPVRKGQITSFFRDKERKWWIGSWNDGLYILEGEEIVNIRNYPPRDESGSLSSNFVRCFCQDRHGKMWIGTFKGLNVYDPQDGSMGFYSDRNSKSGVSSVWGLLCDKTGSIWAGTYFDGIYMFNDQHSLFRHYGASHQPGTGLSSGLVNRFAEDTSGNLWIATDGGGLNMLASDRKSIKWYRKGETSISHNNVTVPYYDSLRNIIWIGTHLGGLNGLVLKTGKIRHFVYDENDKNSLISDIIRDIAGYGKYLLLATNRGVCKFDPESGIFTRMFATGPDRINYANGITVDSGGKVWIYGGSYGIYVYNPLTGKLKGYNASLSLPGGLCCNNVNYIFQDSRERIWICTNKDGIDLYNPETDSFTNFDEAGNSLVSNIVYSAAELPSGKLIFTTDSGFSILDETSMTFSNYFRKNGIPLSSINEKALFVTREGEIFIGGDNGLVSFLEEDLGMTPENYRIYPFSLSIHGKEIHPGESPLKEPLSRTGRIVLQPSQTMFSIEYVTTDFLSDDEKNLEYFLDGFSQSWTSMDGRPVVTFTDLAPGKYTLSVRLKDNLVNTSSSDLEITVLPPLYRRWWAILLYIIAGAIILYVIIRNYKSHVHLVEALKYEQKHSEDIEEMNRQKIRFFTNISHEFRTPLTLIEGNAEMLMQVRSFAPAIYNKILGIYKSSRQLSELITELLDFSRLENGKMKIRVREHNLVKFVYENYLLFKEYANQKNIAFEIVKTDSEIPLWYDSKQMQKVLNNLLSNAFKHTPEGGRINVVIRKENDCAVIEVNDTGRGISPKDLENIFERFYQSEYQNSSSYTGTGIGLSLTKGIVELHHGTIEVFSKQGERTSFIVRLKTGNSHFTEEEMDGDEEIAQATVIQDVPDFKEMPDPEENPERRHILIAEDNGPLRDMLVGIFSPMYSVTSVPDGEQAWDKVREEMPDLVLSDVLMPRMSGTELCRNIKNNPDTCHIPVVLLTARTTLQQNIEGLQSGADDYINKPFNVNILVARCANILNNRQRLKEKFSKEISSSVSVLTTNPLDKRLMELATEAIEKNIDDTEYNADRLAADIGVSRTKLFAKIKFLTGQTPADFILTIRLKQAALMLKAHPEFNISEISDRLGFSSPRQFSKFFKDRYGTIPQQWRKTENTL